MLNEFYHSLSPIAFSIGSIDIRWYGLAYIFGFICAGFIMYFVAKHWKLNMTADDIFVTMVAVAFGLIIGARLFYVIFYNLPYYIEHPQSIIMFNEGGMSFHGGLVGAVLGGYLATKYLKLSFMTMADLAAIGAPIGLFFGRCANFINGELWGKPTDLPWGVIFETGGDIARHPSQLYEAILEGIVIFIVLICLAKKYPPRNRGTYIGTFLILYAVFRFCIEFVRVPDAQLGYLASFITMGQLLSLPVFIAGIIILIWSKKKALPQVGRLY